MVTGFGGGGNGLGFSVRRGFAATGCVDGGAELVVSTIVIAGWVVALTVRVLAATGCGARCMTVCVRLAP
jgi:hypothetical protein